MHPAVTPTHSGRKPVCAPLWAVLAVTFVNSLGTGIVTNGVFFVARESYGFGATANYGLGLLLGIFYVAGALGVSPLLLRLAARHKAISTRAVLIFVTTSLGVLCFLPVLADRLNAGTWAIWVFTACYSALSGSLWPMIESYLSGGRRDKALRSAIGRFNVVWGVAVVAAFWMMAPLVKPWPLGIIAILGVLHVFTAAITWPLGAEPGRHLESRHEPHPPVYRSLLGVLRILLPTSYFIAAAWQPFAPTAVERIGVAVAWQTPLVATWMASRVIIFFVMERWHGWHGRWPTPLAGAILLGMGFAVSVLSPLVGAGVAGTVAMIVGLSILGLGMGIVYSAALYYAMEVGEAEVSAGGKHEALIGLGFTLGPACGLAGTLGVESGLLSGVAVEVAVLSAVGVVLAGVGLVVARLVLHGAKANAANLPNGATVQGDDR
ncbi:MAG: hypothetical protein DYG93_03410 [Leptolyngbya sp. PLA2]|nr:hypothetical protein [Leptolyngbya sp.]MCE7970702.1 hypothetical protein [Leptolyngbya sp. PL-A2]MCQ3939856.1 hypothetical protein [cyanobacterium CYA1]MCZ7633425.1 MFS transporter [Phycisphaerales bacterium]MDL1903399.1 MFS transporter [Synechococcales cyanobacterium CNB]GIK18098.1 MAG: hypothetical protein BroJett004_02620 [Planctomycetota bacterium]